MNFYYKAMQIKMHKQMQSRGLLHLVVFKEKPI